MSKQSIISGDSRGGSDHGWLKNRFSFSFADYHDPQRMGFESLRVINEDWIAPSSGFPMHPHRNVEIFSYVISGEIEHKDTMGNGSRVKAGGIQFMSAGRGVRHSEFNPSPDKPLELLQIWILPNVGGVEPRYETASLSEDDKRGRLALFISNDGRDGTIKIYQDADIYAGLFHGDERASHTIAEGRRAYIHVARGSVVINGEALSRGDALTVDGGEIDVSGGDKAEILLFDLAVIQRR